MYKHSLKRFLETRNYIFIRIILRNLLFFKFFLPSDRDYMALTYFSKYINNSAILDIGGNYGQSALSFRKIGFKKNKIFIFEINSFLINYLHKIKDTNMFIKNFGLGNKNEIRYMYTPYKNKIPIEPLSSVRKNVLIYKLKYQYPSTFEDIKIVRKKIILKKYDNLKISENIKLIKIDVEGFEDKVLQGMLKTIKLYKPIILLEYNRDSFINIVAMLNKYYSYYIYNHKKKLFLKLNRKYIKYLCSHRSESIEQKIRNIFLIKNNNNLFSDNFINIKSLEK